MDKIKELESQLSILEQEKIVLKKYLEGVNDGFDQAKMEVICLLKTLPQIEANEMSISVFLTQLTSIIKKIDKLSLNDGN